MYMHKKYEKCQKLPNDKPTLVINIFDNKV